MVEGGREGGGRRQGREIGQADKPVAIAPRHDPVTFAPPLIAIFHVILVSAR